MKTSDRSKVEVQIIEMTLKDAAEHLSGFAEDLRIVSPHA